MRWGSPEFSRKNESHRNKIGFPRNIIEFDINKIGFHRNKIGFPRNKIGFPIKYYRIIVKK